MTWPRHYCTSQICRRHLHCRGCSNCRWRHRSVSWLQCCSASHYRYRRNVDLLQLFADYLHIICEDSRCAETAQLYTLIESILIFVFASLLPASCWMVTLNTISNSFQDLDHIGIKVITNLLNTKHIHCLNIKGPDVSLVTRDSWWHAARGSFYPDMWHGPSSSS